MFYVDAMLLYRLYLFHCNWVYSDFVSICYCSVDFSHDFTSLREVGAGVYGIWAIRAARAFLRFAPPEATCDVLIVGASAPRPAAAAGARRSKSSTEPLPGDRRRSLRGAAEGSGPFSFSFEKGVWGG